MWLTPLMVMLVIGVVSVAVVALTRYREGRNGTKLLGGEHSVVDPAFVPPVAATSIPGQKNEVEDAEEGEESDAEPDGELLETENDQEEDSPETESDEPYEITANGLDSAEILEEAEIRDAAIDLNESQENLPESGEITAGNDQDNDQGAESAGLQGHNKPEASGEPEDGESTETEDAPEKEEKGEA